MFFTGQRPKGEPEKQAKSGRHDLQDLKLALHERARLFYNRLNPVNDMAGEWHRACPPWRYRIEQMG